MSTPHDVLDFWFHQHGPDDWFSGAAVFDVACASRFGQLHEQASRGELYAWRTTLEGRRAEIILLDQLSRQLHRGSPKAFAQDKMALTLAQQVVADGQDRALSTDEKMFVYLPYMHAESLVIQEISLALHATPEFDKVREYAQGHRDCIARFGRFPKRNQALGRVSTPEELDYMANSADRVF